MADGITANYGLVMPEELSLMRDVEQYVTHNFEKLENRADPTVIAAGDPLPQAGDYEVGDRVFRADASTATTYPSSYILMVKDANWGWHWRPIQQMMAPWVELPDTIINDTDFEIDPDFPVAISYDSSGWVHWRGSLKYNIVGIPDFTSYSIFKTLPIGLRPHLRLLRHVPISPVFAGTGETGFVGGRIYLQEEGSGSFRFYNTDNPASLNIWLTGLMYQPSRVFFNAP